MANNVLIKTNPEAAEITTSALSSGATIVASVSSGSEIIFRTIVGGGNVEVTQQANTITVSAPSVITRYPFYAANFENPNNANWAVSALSPANVDSINNALTIRQFDDTNEEGVGFYITIPAGFTNITFNFKQRRQTAGAATNNVVWRIHRRAIPDAGAPSGWSVTALTAQSMPAGTAWRYRSQTFTLAALSLTAGTLYQFELTRQGAAAGDTLAGDLNLIELLVDFS